MHEIQVKKKYNLNLNMKKLSKLKDILTNIYLSVACERIRKIKERHRLKETKET